METSLPGDGKSDDSPLLLNTETAQCLLRQVHYGGQTPLWAKREVGNLTGRFVRVLVLARLDRLRLRSGASEDGSGVQRSPIGPEQRGRGVPEVTWLDRQY